MWQKSIFQNKNYIDSTFLIIKTTRVTWGETD